MFSKVLIANRGEIACRIIRTCHTLGIKAAVVYSEADSKALHVKMADEAVEIGPPAPRESYLKIEAVVKAALKVKADAIHPGYGFLSENADFVEAVEKAGITFVGPSAQVIAQMGDKVSARRLAQEHDVPVIPGTEGAIDDAEAEAAAAEVGYPIMVKAADGGGGMGIRVVSDPAELAEAIASARSQAESAFGSSRIYLERRLIDASHVEVQVLGDKHGNVVHLFERDCSVQRRNQKIIEETPCAKISPETREEMTAAAVRLAKGVGYSNAGTVEFLLDQDHEHFYFLEMNTRLQVEHPITEMVTGIDLVELQLRIAAGEALPFAQDEIEQRGAAIEARIYPEDPSSMLPTAGRVEKLAEPSGYDVRVDSALYRGYEVLPHYEPLMAKLIVRGKDRDAAIARLQKALDDYVIEGVVTNIPLVSRVLARRRFTSASYATGLLDEMLEQPSGATGKEHIAAIAVAMALRQNEALSEMPSKWKMHGRRALMVNRLS